MVKLSDLDKKDLAILAELDGDCRQSNAEIARKLRLGKHVVSYRIAQLEKSGAITNYYTVVDMARLGLQSYRVYLRLYPMTKSERKAILEHLIRSPATWWVGEMDGHWSIGIGTWVNGHYEFEKFWNGFTARFQRFIEESRVSVYLRAHGHSHSFLSENEGERRIYLTGAAERCKIDEADRCILNALASNARLGTLEIARKTKLSPVQVAYRIKKMLKNGVIVGFRANLSLEDMTLYKADFQLTDTKRKADMLAFASSEKWTEYVDESMGYADFEMEMLCPSYSEFKSVVERFTERFSGSMKGYDFSIYSKVLKVKYF